MRVALSFMVLGFLCSVLAAGCGAAGGGIPNLNSSAAPLEVENLFYNSSRMETARYSHTATELNNGQILVIGGTDERHVTSLDTAEIFDQSVTPGGPLIDSITGIWFDTDFQGDTIAMKNGGRIFHTASPLSSGNILVAGGAPDSLNAAGHPDSEIYQVQSRKFDPEELQIPDGSDMVEPRFHHVAIRQPNGKIMFMGGQKTQDETLIDPNFFPGDPRFMIELTVFPSTESIEEFDPATRTFSRVKDAAGLDTELLGVRGRHNHAAVTIAGPDNRLNTSDDVILVGGGQSTLSGIFAPTNKLPGHSATSDVKSLEYFDPVTRSMSVAPNAAFAERANGVMFKNLGELVGETPDGVRGVGNVVLLTHGDNNNSIQTSQGFSELVAVTFTGFGPTGGITFEDLDIPFFNQEHVDANPLCAIPFGRTQGDAIMLRANRLIADVNEVSSWLITCGGVHMFVTPAGGQGQSMTRGGCSNEVIGVQFYDPFWNRDNLFVIDPHGVSAAPWDLTTTRSDDNPTGIMGTWLHGHVPPGAVPENDYLGWPEVGTLAQPNQSPGEGRVFMTLSRLAGVDGAPNTGDDRMLVAGGGDSYYPEFGGEAVTLDTQVYVPPGANLNLVVNSEPTP